MTVRDELPYNTPSPPWGEGRGEGPTSPTAVPIAQDPTA